MLVDLTLDSQNQKKEKFTANSKENLHVDHGCKQVKMEPVQRKGNFNIISET